MTKRKNLLRSFHPLAVRDVRVMLEAMTLKVRRILLDIMLVPALVAAATASAAWITWFRGDYAAGYRAPYLTAAWWGSWHPTVPQDLTWAMAGLTFLAFFPLIAEGVLRNRFGRNPSPEIFFLRFVLLTLPIQAVRFAIPLAATDFVAAISGITITRVAWFGRLLGLVGAMNMGLYGGDIPFRRSGAILGMGALAALAISAMLPLDVTQPLGNLIFRPGTATSLALICVVMEALAVLSLVGTAASQSQSRYYLLAFALLLALAGSDMAFFVSRPLLIPGAGMLVGGTIIFAREIRKIYQWV